MAKGTCDDTKRNPKPKGKQSELIAVIHGTISEERKKRILTLMNTEEGKRRIDEILEAAAATTDRFVEASQSSLCKRQCFVC